MPFDLFSTLFCLFTLCVLRSPSSVMPVSFILFLHLSSPRAYSRTSLLASYSDARISFCVERVLFRAFSQKRSNQWYSKIPCVLTQDDVMTRHVPRCTAQFWSTTVIDSLQASLSRFDSAGQTPRVHRANHQTGQAPHASADRFQVPFM